jgi:hypothetical protein
MPLRLVAAHRLVASLPVYRTLVGLVAVSDSLYGVAVSDPYLSFSKPVSSVATLPSLATLVAELQCGALVVGLPFAATGLQSEHKARQLRVLSALLREPALADGLLACAFAPAAPPTAASVAKLHRENLLWDQTGLDELGEAGEAREASIVAAVSLQLFLDEHSGGWANTFG